MNKEDTEFIKLIKILQKRNDIEVEYSKNLTKMVQDLDANSF